MKTICWNDELIIKAENDQDAMWLFNYARDLCDIKNFDEYVELEIGEFDSDGNLEDFGNMYLEDFRKEIKSKSFGDRAVYIQTNHEEETGETGKVVSITFNPMGY